LKASGVRHQVGWGEPTFMALEHSWRRLYRPGAKAGEAEIVNPEPWSPKH
jgi:hypothetical protein